MYFVNTFCYTVVAQNKLLRAKKSIRSLEDREFRIRSLEEIRHILDSIWYTTNVYR